MNHTPGPWKSGGAMLCVLNHNNERVCDPYTRKPDEEVIANIKLIAAAPELLEALEKLIRCASGIAMTDELAFAYAAIRKARGE